MIRLAAPQIGDEECEAVSNVLKSGFLVQGESVRRFEARIARYVGTRFAAAVSNGTAALYVSLMALGIGPGDAVFVPAFTFPATFSVVELRGARPVLVDVDPETYCMTPSGLRGAVDQWKGSERARAVVPVHEFGAPCDMTEIMGVARKHGLRVIEDAACALGSYHEGYHVGTFGATGCFSWHPRKGITTGEGGSVVTSDPDLHDRVLSLRNHGLSGPDSGTADLVAPSLNFRMTEFQAALGREQLRRFPRWLATRKRLAGSYLSRLRNVPGLRLPKALDGHSWQSFMVVLPRSSRRDAMEEALRRRNIESGLGAHAIHMLSYCRKKYEYERDDFPVAAELYQWGLALPMHARLTGGDVETVCDHLEKRLTKRE